MMMLIIEGEYLDLNRAQQAEENDIMRIFMAGICTKYLNHRTRADSMDG
jgi:hypothetical protein